MFSQHHDEWPEHAVCARCAAPLNENYRVSPLGLRFCSDCFDTAIQEKVRERAAKIYLQGHCSSCGNSLINGYRLSQLGVLYCIPCFDNLPKTPEQKTDEQAPAQTAPNEGGRSAGMIVVEGVLWVSLASAHLLFFINALPLIRHKRYLLHPDSYLGGLICLDLLTLLLLVVSRRSPASRLTLFLSLLIITGFIILIGREIVSLIS